MKWINQLEDQKDTLIVLLVAIIICFSSSNVFAQQESSMVRLKAVKLNGPRLGFTYVGPGEMTDKLDEFDKVPYFTQFGWQFETRTFTLENGTSGLIEYILLIGGLEQNMFLPSATMLIGLRTGSGFEFGAGPNLSVTGAAFAFAVGFTIKSEYMYFPINIAVIPSDKGVRFSLLFGFNAINR